MVLNHDQYVTARIEQEIRFMDWSMPVELRINQTIYLDCQNK
jgi:hypothetical protein